MPARTKSCAICRKKRIKCDATIPQCLMCIRFGRQCPGLQNEPLIVDMTAKAGYGMQKRRPQNSKAIVKAGHGRGASCIRQQRISLHAVIAEAFYGRFLSSWTSEGDQKDIKNKESWLHRLPRLSTDGTNKALGIALQATASSFCALETGDMALTRHAWDLYGQAVQSHNSFLTRSRNRRDGITIHMISTSVLFSFFETMQATTADAYRSHVWGAVKMFEVVDPQQCSEGVLCQLFFHLRTQMAFIQLTTNGEKPRVAVQDILHKALKYEELPIFQRLTTCFSKLAEMYSEDDLDDIGGESKKDVNYPGCVAIQAEVEDLWHEYNAGTLLNGEILAWRDTSTNTTHYRDAFTALTIAYFSAVHILVEVITSKSMILFSDTVDHFSRVLEIAQLLGTMRVGCVYMRMAAPLLLVALHAPAMSQRLMATGYFSHWKAGGMKGISELASDYMERYMLLEREPYSFQGTMGHEDMKQRSDVNS